MSIRWVLTDAQWAKMEPHCLGKPSDPGRSGANNPRFVEAVLWIARTGSPWRDLPEEFGKWNTVFKRFRDWVKADVFAALFDAVSEQLDLTDAASAITFGDRPGSLQVASLDRELLRQAQGVQAHRNAQ